ncbi:ribosomal RNA large subunit methyltransferase E [Elysia marginata]|uniref:rRNA methyltransferase 2, mitochondrial n=1 Tax=Elysia marginata TaxID=1093978 RepID=A0AAV4H0W8_9GAST|nr:ribosomal RNA large subunit methyltransferase E [Elysia marginata]
MDICNFSTALPKHAKKPGVSSNEWLRRQRKDLYVKQAGKENYRCRSAFKLKQINDRFKILKPGHVVIDCGAAPGSWCQVAAQEVNADGEDVSQPRGTVIGIDLQNMAPIDGVHLLSLCDFTSEGTQNCIRNILQDRKADVLLSDMAPAATGVKSHNHEAIIKLCFSVLKFGLSVVREGGTIVCKLWTGGDQPRLEKAMHAICENVRVVKPDASRGDSAEIFLMGRGFRGFRNPP